MSDEDWSNVAPSLEEDRRGWTRAIQEADRLFARLSRDPGKPIKMCPLGHISGRQGCDVCGDTFSITATGPDRAPGSGSDTSAPAEDGAAAPLYGPRRPVGHDGDTSGAT